MERRFLVALLLGFTLATAPIRPVDGAEPTPWLAGLSRVDVTPTEPVRMAGYGSRDHASEGVDTPLHVRCLAFRHVDGGALALLISIDTIGLPGSMTRELVESIQEHHEIDRENVVFACTHTHCGPDLVSELSNIFATPLTEQEIAAGERYKKQLGTAVMEAVDQAVRDLQPAAFAYGSGEASFAANRRVLTDGRWTGFGVQADGPVDHSVPVLRISDAEGKVRGIVFNYACHCTTLGGDHYRINGDWAGYAASDLESMYPGAVALSTIGCGADANPEPRGTLDATRIHGRTLAAEVRRLVDGSMKPVVQTLAPRFDYAALTFELPTQEELESRTSSTNPQEKRHAEQLLSVLDEHGRLPATYPVPIQSWRFGDDLTMVFLGGEVVVDYAHRLKRELNQPDLWVTAYANDVLGYISSERMIAEGGYEYDRSGVFYGLPGPWASGTEDTLISRVTDLLKSRGRSKPLSVEDALRSFDLTGDFEIEVVASEPLVRDPINVAFDASGRLWVTEMGGYPEENDGGRVKRLTDTDGDGRYDEATVFLDDLSYPTGAMPWGDGVLVSAAPDVFLARDTNADGRADEEKKLYSGFRLANPQHRVNGFTYGLDHSLHLASGDNLSELTSLITGKKVNASGHDVQIWPDSGDIDVTCGRTQYIRSRNDWGEWFGNDNSRPMYHFPIDDRYLSRNPAQRISRNNQQLFEPPVAPPVFAMTSAAERFNDLFAANRFTSACSSIIARAPEFASDIEGDDDVALICEPVHNLVHRAVLKPSGASYQATRCEQESESEFLRSSDPWFRPVRALVGPDGCLYIVDMYRETIEHPEWIPESWQAQLDLYAGSDRGRIYRVRSKDQVPEELDVASRETEELIQELRSPIGPRRDLVQQLILERRENGTVQKLSELAGEGQPPETRAHALSMLQVLGELDDEVLAAALSSGEPGLLLVAIRLSEPRLKDNSSLLEALGRSTSHDDKRVALRAALALGECDTPRAGELLAQLSERADLDWWLAQAIGSSAIPHAEVIADRLIESMDTSPSTERLGLLTGVLATMKHNGIDIAQRYSQLFEQVDGKTSTQLQLASSFSDALGSDASQPFARILRPLYSRAVERVRSSEASDDERCVAMRLVGLGIDSHETDSQLLLDLLNASSPVTVQKAAVDRLVQFADVDTVERLLAGWPAMTQSIRSHCVSRVLERRLWTEKLLDALETGQIKASDLTPAARQQLAHTGSRSMRVRAERLTRLGSSSEKRELIEIYMASLGSRGDVAKGAAVFKKQCAVCHIANESGEAIGASLNNLTDRSGRALLTSILDPNRAVDPKYLSYIVLTDDDRTLVGAIEEEAGTSLTLAHADGKRTTVNRGEIADIKNSGVSLMPEGLESVISTEMMSDLVAFLQSTTNLERIGETE